MYPSQEVEMGEVEETQTVELCRVLTLEGRIQD